MTISESSKMIAERLLTFAQPQTNKIVTPKLYNVQQKIISLHKEWTRAKYSAAKLPEIQNREKGNEFLDYLFLKFPLARSENHVQQTITKTKIIPQDDDLELPKKRQRIIIQVTIFVCHVLHIVRSIFDLPIF